MAAPGQRGKKGRSMDGGLCLLLTTHGAEASAGRSWETEGEGMVPQGQPSGAGIPDHNGKERKSVLHERMLAVEE